MRKWDKLLPSKAAALRRHVESVATERNDIVSLWLLCRYLHRELYRVSGVLSMVDVREHLRAQDAWRAQRERLKHGIDIAALFTEDDEGWGMVEEFAASGAPLPDADAQ